MKTNTEVNITDVQDKGLITLFECGPLVLKILGIADHSWKNGTRVLIGEIINPLTNDIKKFFAGKRVQLSYPAVYNALKAGNASHLITETATTAAVKIGEAFEYSAGDYSVTCQKFQEALPDVITDFNTYNALSDADKMLYGAPVLENGNFKQVAKK